MDVGDCHLITIGYACERSQSERGHFFEVIEGGEAHDELVASGPVEEVEQSVLIDVFRRHRDKTRMVNFADFARWATSRVVFEACQEVLFNFLECCAIDKVPQRPFNLYLGYGSYHFAAFNTLCPVIHGLRRFRSLVYVYFSIDHLPPPALKERQMLVLDSNIHGLQLNLNDSDDIPSEWMTDNIRTLLIRSTFPRIHFTTLLKHIQQGHLDQLRLIQVIRSSKMTRSDVDALASRLREILDSSPQRDPPIAIKLDYDGGIES
ncbi:hypothetical protein TRICI_003516 [Trichomonascus ciferrii]|uniref:Uncharacterized protein n=1 Tax=Trichomonascus ciferrii TaxID=44093 RepID=A0A642V3S3_9ASCO|nr:hypothetical protein TRICI_003516 [Trichomonascus ciferrii]